MSDRAYHSEEDNSDHDDDTSRDFSDDEESDSERSLKDGGFVHKPLRDPIRDIRLVIVRAAKKGAMPSCTIQNFQRDQAPPYRALSYCWGPKEYWTIEINDGEFSVHENLHAVLEHIAEFQYYEKGYHNGAAWWWIDALCIMQDEDSEPERLA